MNEKKNKGQAYRDVIQRYCPRRGEDVIMLRTYDDGYHTECMHYDICEMKKDNFCGNGGRSTC